MDEDPPNSNSDVVVVIGLNLEVVGCAGAPRSDDGLNCHSRSIGLIQLVSRLQIPDRGPALTLYEERVQRRGGDRLTIHGHLVKRHVVVDVEWNPEIGPS